MTLIVPESWRRHWRGRDIFECILSLQGEEYRNMDGRRTLRFELLGGSYFAKLYRGIGWRRILRSLLTLRQPPVLGARNEYRAIQRLHELDIATMTVVAFGERGLSPARRQSFLVTEELRGCVSLEDFCRPWRETAPPPALKRALIAYLARVSRQLHSNGINHRDYYLCHFLLKVGNDGADLDSTTLTAYLIDLHRVQFHKRLPLRWRVKDLASLYFSAMEIGFTQRDYYRFIRIYCDCPLRQALEQQRLWRRVSRRGDYLLRRFYRKYAHERD